METVRIKDNKNETVGLWELERGDVFDYGNNKLYLYIESVRDEYSNKYNCVSLEDGELDFIAYDEVVTKVNMKAMEVEE